MTAIGQHPSATMESTPRATVDALLDAAVDWRARRAFAVEGVDIGSGAGSRRPTPIPARAEEPGRPLWSVMIPARDPADPDHLRLAIESAMRQDIDPDAREIVVVDDASERVDIAAIVADYRPLVGYNRNPARLGLVGNFNRCLELSRGRLVHLLHQDDYVETGFYSVMAAPFAAPAPPAGAFCRFAYVHDHGGLIGLSDLERGEAGLLDAWMPELAAANLIQCAAMVVARSTYEAVGGFDESLPFTSDWDMWARVLAHGGIWFAPEQLAAFRVHARSATRAISPGARLDEVLACARAIGARGVIDRRASFAQAARRALHDRWREARRDAVQADDAIAALAGELIRGWGSAADQAAMADYLAGRSAQLTTVPHRLTPRPEAVDGDGRVDAPIAIAIEGRLDHFDGLTIHGWARDKNNPVATLSVAVRIESLDADGRTAAVTERAAKANLAREDLTQAEIGAKGFRVSLPLHVFDGGRKRVHVRTADGAALVGSPIEFTARGAVGALESWNDGAVIGGVCWSVIPARRPVHVSIARGGATIARARADRRGSMGQLGIEHRVAFEAPLPGHLEDGGTHVLTMAVEGDPHDRPLATMTIDTSPGGAARARVEEICARALARTRVAPDPLLRDAALDQLGRWLGRFPAWPDFRLLPITATLAPALTVVILAGDDPARVGCAVAAAVVASIDRPTEFIIMGVDPPAPGGAGTTIAVRPEEPMPARWRRAVAAARARKVLFLDDRAILDPGAIAAMLTASEEQGVRFVVPRIETAGGRLDEETQSMLGEPIGAHGAPLLPARDERFAYRRPVDAITPTAALVDRSSIEFLARVEPADPCWPVALAALAGPGSCVYAPAARVIRFGPPAIVAAPRPRAAPRALFVDHAAPEDGRSAGASAAMAEMEVLRRLGYDVAFADMARRDDGPGVAGLRDRGIRVVHGEDMDWRAIARRVAPDVIFVYRFHVAERVIDALRRGRPGAKIVFNTVDVHGLRAARLAALSGDGADAARARDWARREMAIIAASDLTLVYSGAELEHLRALGAERVAVAPWIAQARGGVPAWSERDGVVFLGNFNHEPNVDAARFLVNEIMPLLWRRHPGITLEIFGAGTGDAIRSLANERVFVRGYAPSLEQVYDRARVVAAPIRFGAGLKGKVATALCHGMPIVLSPMAAEGFDLEDGVEALQAGNPEDFAQALHDLHEDEASWTRMSAAALNFARRRFDRDAARATIRGLLAGLGLPAS